MSQKTNNSGSRSDIGCVRDTNEDALISQKPLYAIADGMGGHAAGEVASELAVDILADNIAALQNADALIDIIRLINRSIIEAADEGLGRPGMGTTLTAAVLDGTRLLIAQVGDSRAYLLHGGTLQQLTRDHSYVGELLAGGHISASEAAVHPKRSVITRALGSDPKTEADIYELEATLGDRLLICSDGLYGMVPEPDITQILGRLADPQAAADELVDTARQNGGLDNISVIVVDILDDVSEFLTFSGEEPWFEHDRRRHAGSGGQGLGAALRGSGAGAGAGSGSGFGSDSGGAANRSRSRSRGRASRRAAGRAGSRLYLGVITFLVLLALLIGGSVGGLYWYAHNSAFLRSEAGVVVVYRGLPGEILPGLRLEWREYATDVRTRDLLTSTAARLEEGVRVDSLNAAAELVAEYEQQIRDNTTHRLATPGSSGKLGAVHVAGNAQLASTQPASTQPSSAQQQQSQLLFMQPQQRWSPA